jgi:hypothetical protein
LIRVPSELQASLFLLETGGRDENFDKAPGSPAGLGALAWADEIESSPLGRLSKGILKIGGGRKGKSGPGLAGGPRDRDALLMPVLNIHSTREPGSYRGGQSRTSGGTIVGLSLELWNLD